MSSFVFQPTKEEAAQTADQSNQKYSQSAIYLSPTIRKSLLKSQTQLKSSITLEDRGIVLGKSSKIIRTETQTDDKFSRVSKIECDDSQAIMVDASIARSNKQKERNPERDQKNQSYGEQQQVQQNLIKSGSSRNQQNREQLQGRNKAPTVIGNQTKLQTKTFFILITILVLVIITSLNRQGWFNPQNLPLE